MDEASELLMGTRFRKPISKLEMDDKAMIKNNLPFESEGRNLLRDYKTCDSWI